MTYFKFKRDNDAGGTTGDHNPDIQQHSNPTRVSVRVGDDPNRKPPPPPKPVPAGGMKAIGGMVDVIGNIKKECNYKITIKRKIIRRENNNG